MELKRGKMLFFSEDEFLALTQELQKGHIDSSKGKAMFFSDESFTPDTQELQSYDVDKSENPILEETSPIVFGETQGRKGFKVSRINMGFSPENHDWLRLRSRQRGMTITEFVNKILDRERLRE